MLFGNNGNSYAVSVNLDLCIHAYSSQYGEAGRAKGIKILGQRGMPRAVLGTRTIGSSDEADCVWNVMAHETRFRLSAKRTSPFKSAGASVQSTADSRGVRISGSNAGYTMFRGSVKSTGYTLHSPVSPSLPLPCVTVCHHISTGLYPGANLGLGRLGSCLGR